MAKARTLLLFALAIGFSLNHGAFAQTANSGGAQAVDRAGAYYHFAMGHLYAELAGLYGNRGEYLTRAIDEYKLAMKAGYLSGRLNSTVYLSRAWVDPGLIVLKLVAMFPPMVVMRSIEKTTSSAVISVPSWKRRPFFRRKVYFKPSGDIFQDSAIQGTYFFSGSG